MEWISGKQYHFESPRSDVVIDIYDQRLTWNGIIIGKYKYLKGVSCKFCWPDSSTFLNFDIILSKKALKYDIMRIIQSKGWKALSKATIHQNVQEVIMKLRLEATVSCKRNLTSTFDCDENPCLFNIIEDPCESNNIAKKFPILLQHMEANLNGYKLGIRPEDPEAYIEDPKSNPELHNGTWSWWET